MGGKQEARRTLCFLPSSHSNAFCQSRLSRRTQITAKWTGWKNQNSSAHRSVGWRPGPGLVDGSLAGLTQGSCTCSRPVTLGLDGPRWSPLAPFMYLGVRTATSQAPPAPGSCPGLPHVPALYFEGWGQNLEDSTPKHVQCHFWNVLLATASHKAGPVSRGGKWPWRGQQQSHRAEQEGLQPPLWPIWHTPPGPCDRCVPPCLPCLQSPLYSH